MSGDNGVIVNLSTRSGDVQQQLINCNLLAATTDYCQPISKRFSTKNSYRDKLSSQEDCHPELISANCSGANCSVTSSLAPEKTSAMFHRKRANCNLTSSTCSLASSVNSSASLAWPTLPSSSFTSSSLLATKSSCHFHNYTTAFSSPITKCSLSHQVTSSLSASTDNCSSSGVIRQSAVSSTLPTFSSSETKSNDDRIDEIYTDKKVIEVVNKDCNNVTELTTASQNITSIINNTCNNMVDVTNTCKHLLSATDYSADIAPRCTLDSITSISNTISSLSRSLDNCQALSHKFSISYILNLPSRNLVPHDDQRLHDDSQSRENSELHNDLLSNYTQSQNDLLQDSNVTVGKLIKRTFQLQ